VYNRKIIIPFEIIPKKTDSTLRTESHSGQKSSTIGYRRDSEKPGGRGRDPAVLSGFKQALSYIVTYSHLPFRNQPPFPARNRPLGCKRGRGRQKRRNYPPPRLCWLCLQAQAGRKVCEAIRYMTR